MICPHCQSSIEGPLDGNHCPECGRTLGHRECEDNRREIVATLETAPRMGGTDLPAEQPADDKYAPTLALAPGDSSTPPSGSEAPADAEPFDETLRLASDTATPTTAANQDLPQPTPGRTEAVSPFPPTSPTNQPGEQTTDFPRGSRGTELIGLPTDFTPGMSLKATPANLIGPDNLALRPFVVQPRGKKSDEPTDYTLLAGPFMGGMGKVFRAQQRSLRRDVAIKQIRDELRKVAEERGKFVTEAIITGELEHPNIIPIHDLGLVKQDAAAGDEESDIGVDLFYAMKFVEGNDWKEELPKLTEAENIDVLLKVADAISFAHSRNIIHRDLKPGNIRLGKFGEVLVMDWGLAARLDAPEGFPPAGTPIYMAPEMAIEFLQFSRNQILRQLGTGRSLSPTGRTAVGKHSDIYLLGALLFHVITGRAPHSGSSGKECIQNASKNKIVETDVQSELLDIALKAMATNPQDRYATVVEFQQALRSYKSHVESISLANEADADARAAEALSADGKKQAKQVYDLFSSARYGFRNALRIWSENERARERLRETEQLFAETAFANNDFDLALTLLDPANPDQQPLHEKVTRAAQEREQRVRKLKRLRQTLFAVVTLAFVVTSVLLAFWKRAYDKNVALYGDNEKLTATKSDLEKNVESLNNAVASATEDTKRANQARADAEKAATDAEQRATAAVQNAAAAQQKQMMADANAANSSYRAAFQSAVTALLDSGPKKAFAAMPSMTAAPVGEADWEWRRLFYLSNWERSATRIGGGAKPIHFVSCSVASRRLITGANRAGGAVIEVWEAHGQNPSIIRTYSVPSADIHAVNISADGRWAAAGLGHHYATLVVWDIESASEASVYEVGDNRAVTAVAFSPAAPWELLAGDSAGNVSRWVTQGNQLVRTDSYPGQVWGAVRSIAFSADGKCFVTAGAGERINLYEPGEAKEPWPLQLDLATSNPEVSAVAFFPGDSDRIVGGCNDGSFYLLSGLVELRQTKLRMSDWAPPRPMPLDRHLGPIRGLAFSENGKSLITCSDDQFVSLWDVEHVDGSLSVHKRVTRRIHDAPVPSCAISADGRYAYSADTSGEAYRWDLNKVDDFVTIPPSGGGDRTNRRPIQAVHVILPAANSGMTRIVVGDGAGFVRAVDGAQPNAPTELYVGHRDHALMTAQYIASPNPRLVTRTPDGTACLWDVRTGSLERSVSLLNGAGPQDANVFAASSDGRYLVGLNNDEDAPQLAATIWDVARDNLTSFRLANHAVTALAITGQSSDGIPRLLVGHRFGLLQLWNGRWNQLGDPDKAPHRGTIAAIAMHRNDFAYIADIGRTIEEGKDVSKWSLQGLQPAFTGTAYRFPAAGNTADIRLRLSHDGRTLGVIQADDAGRVVGLHVLNTSDLQPIVSRSTSSAPSPPAAPREYRVQSAELLDVAISSNGQVIGMATENRLTQWDTDAKAWRPHASTDQFHAVASQLHERTKSSNLTRIEFIGDARVLAYGDGIVLVWNFETSQLEHRIQSRAAIEAAAIIPGAQAQVATISSDGRYSRWEQPAGSSTKYRLVDQRFLTQFGHTRAVTSPDGKQALVAATELGNDSSSLELVELATGERTPVATIPGRILAMTWAGSGERLAVAISDSDGLHGSVIDAASRQEIAAMPLQLPKPPTCMALDPDGRRIAVGAGDDVYYAADSNWNELQHGDSLGHDVSALALSQSGRRLAIGDVNGTITLRAIEEPGDRIGRVADTAQQESFDRTVMLLAGHDAEITTLKFAQYGAAGVEVLVSGDIHGKTLVHLASGEKRPASNPAQDTPRAAEVAP